MSSKVSDTVKILVCCHKADSCIRKSDIYEPIQVGKSISNTDLGFLSDNDTICGGGNISVKNREYCELTALYWAWKEMRPSKFVGLAHYRRYFDKSVTFSSINNWLEKGQKDIICCKPVILDTSAYKDLMLWISPENTIIMLDALAQLYPEYWSDAVKYLRSNEWIPCNMMITKWETFEIYCEWLFPILELTEKRIIKSGYDRINRTYGYIAEVLLGIFIMHNKLRVKHVDMDDLSVGSSKKSIKDKGNELLQKIGFQFVLRNKNWVDKLTGNHRKNKLWAPDSVINSLKNQGIFLKYFLKLNS